MSDFPLVLCFKNYSNSSHQPHLQNNQHNFPPHWVVRENNVNRCLERKSTDGAETHHRSDVSILSLLTRRAGQTLRRKTNILQLKERKVMGSSTKMCI